MNAQSTYIVVMTTTAPEEAATNKIVDALLSKKLAACIQVMPIKSAYWWKGKVTVEAEHLLLVKAKAALYAKIEACIKENHAYEVPEITQVPIVAGSAAYLSWIDEVSA